MDPATTDDELRDTRQKLRETRGKLQDVRQRERDVRRAYRRARDELAVLREFTLDVFPDVVVPPEVQRVAEGVRAEKLTYLTPAHLDSLAACVLETEQAGRPGLLVEAGTALGGSAIVMAAAKHRERPMAVYDVFGMIPPPSEKDSEAETERYQQLLEGESGGLDGDVYYGYRDDLLAEVTASFARFGFPVEESGVRLVKGLFADTLDLDEPVALAHLDGDWYESTMVCLERIAPLVVPGGRIVLDDYFNWEGCRRAVDEYFAGRHDFRVEHRAKVHAVRLDA